MKKGNLRVLIVAYACEPGKGSEAEVGWGWLLQISKFAEVFLITRKNNVPSVSDGLKKLGIGNVKVFGFDLPKVLRFWKKGERGVYLYYFLWSFWVFIPAFRLSLKYDVDVVHHLTFVNNWIPPGVALIPKKFIWGPIGTNPAIPFKSCDKVSRWMKSFLREALKILARTLNPLTYIALLRAKVLIAINKDLKRDFPFNLFCRKIVVIPAIGLDGGWINREGKFSFGEREEVNILYVGRVYDVKGWWLLCPIIREVLEKRENVKFTIILSGGEMDALAHCLTGISKERVEVLGKIPREKLLAYYDESDIFLFPSFEGGGMVVLEAMARGIPVVCFDFGGPGEMVSEECGIKIKPRNYKKIVEDFSNALIFLVDNPQRRRAMGLKAMERVKRYLWDGKGLEIRKVYEEFLGK